MNRDEERRGGHEDAEVVGEEQEHSEYAAHTLLRDRRNPSKLRITRAVKSFAARAECECPPKPYTKQHNPPTKHPPPDHPPVRLHHNERRRKDGRNNGEDVESLDLALGSTEQAADLDDALRNTLKGDLDGFGGSVHQRWRNQQVSSVLGIGQHVETLD